MRTLQKNILLVIFLVGGSLISKAQDFTISGEFRPRIERHEVMLRAGDEAITLFTQRSRIKFDYTDTTRGYKARFTLQDARAWGSTNQFALNDQKASLMPYEGWVDVNLAKTFSVKIGRQVIKYDDQRMFGENDFQQQSRSHDAVLFKYDGNFNLHIGGAYNNNTVPLEFVDQPYDLKNYKTMQFLHFHKTMGKLDLSLTALNNGIEIEYETAMTPTGPQNDTLKQVVYSQTLGFHSEYKINKIMKFSLLGYYQMGESVVKAPTPGGILNFKQDLNAYNIKAEFTSGLIPKKMLITLGYEIFSGNDPESTTGENNSFSFMYGSVIKNLGINSMYHFAPPTSDRHSSNLGVTNATVDIKFMATKKLSFRNRTMFVGSMYESANMDGKSLGIENDFFLMYKMNDQVMFRGIAAVFSINDNLRQTSPLVSQFETDRKIQSWFSFGCLITPTFFTTKKKKS